MDYDVVDIEPRVAVIGIGGAGCNVVSDVYRRLPSVDAIAVNTDRDALHETQADTKLYICKSVTKGEGTKGDSLLGRRCAQAHLEEIEQAISGHDAVFIIAGMGGGTGTGAAPIIAEIAERLNIMTFTVAINPFAFETARYNTAKSGIARLRSVCPMTIVVENDRAAEQLGDLPLRTVFDAVNRSISGFISSKIETIKDTFVKEFEAAIEEEAKTLSDGFTVSGTKMSKIKE